jgi:hypothetical protein
MEVRYRWSFLIGDKPVTKFNTPPKPVMLEEIAEEQEHAEDETKIEVMISSIPHLLTLCNPEIKIRLKINIFLIAVHSDQTIVL